jgi:hypothetical protein
MTMSRVSFEHVRSFGSSSMSNVRRGAVRLEKKAGRTLDHLCDGRLRERHVLVRRARVVRHGPEVRAVRGAVRTANTQVEAVHLDASARARLQVLPLPTTMSAVRRHDAAPAS